MPGRAVSLAEALAAAMAVALDVAKAATLAAVTEEPWLTERAAAMADDAACEQGGDVNAKAGSFTPQEEMRYVGEAWPASGSFDKRFT